ncbi:hypothetical protein [Rhizobium tubonense]|uniref:Uncharacterized protein n=1 Tax=Rhizobium tubonense TaxID=484088 RepID=A0A2W4CEH8_9HYPH|nr:hypothetical protein [Rhizobium tubonense]PZM11482.1 hypothetical protein CPY51_19775 [Rhizobium tubonense]
MVNELRQLITNSVLFRFSAVAEPFPRSHDYSDSMGRSNGRDEERFRSLIEDEAFYWQPTPLSWY